MGSLLGLRLLSGSCSRPLYPDSHAASCYPNHPYDTTSHQWAVPPDSLFTRLLPQYSRYNLVVAHAAGLLAFLQTYQLPRGKLGQDSSLAQRVLLSGQKDRIQDRIALFRTQVASLAAELDCEALRVNRLIVYQDRLEQVQVRNLFKRSKMRRRPSYICFLNGTFLETLFLWIADKNINLLTSPSVIQLYDRACFCLTFCSTYHIVGGCCKRAIRLGDKDIPKRIVT